MAAAILIKWLVWQSMYCAILKKSDAHLPKKSAIANMRQTLQGLREDISGGPRLSVILN